MSSEVNEFKYVISDRGLPVDENDAEAFADNLVRQKAPVGFLRRLAERLQFYDADTFQRDVSSMASKIDEIMQGENFLALLNHAPGSGDWLYKQLMEQGLNSASAGIPMATKQNEGTVPYKLSELILEQTWKHSALDRYAVIDDFALSGGQLTELLQDYSHTRGRTDVFLLRSTEYGRKNLARHASSVHTVGERIRTVREDFSGYDYRFLNKLQKQYSESGIAPDDSLFWAWYKIPDNILYFLTDKNAHPLIRTERFEPSYGHPDRVKALRERGFYT